MVGSFQHLTFFTFYMFFLSSFIFSSSFFFYIFLFIFLFKNMSKSYEINLYFQNTENNNFWYGIVKRLICPLYKWSKIIKIIKVNTFILTTNTNYPIIFVDTSFSSFQTIWKIQHQIIHVIFLSFSIRCKFSTVEWTFNTPIWHFPPYTVIQFNRIALSQATYP